MIFIFKNYLSWEGNHTDLNEISDNLSKIITKRGLMNLDDEKVVKVVMEVGSAVFRLLDNTDTITKEMIIDELERYRKEVTNTVARRVK